MAKRIIIYAIQNVPEITGSDRVAYHTLYELQKLDHTNEYRVLCSSRYPYIGSSLTAPNFKAVRVISGVDKPHALANRLQMLVYKRWLRWFWKPDVYYSFHNMRYPYVRGVPKTVSSVFDLIPILFKEYESSHRHRRERYLNEYRQVVELTDQYVAISEYSRQDLHRELGVPLDKITVMPLAFETSIKATEADKKRVQAKYKLPRDFILALGANEPRKNVGLILKAHELLPKKLQSKYKVVIVGEAWRWQEPTELRKPSTQVLGFVDDADLPALYALATVFVFPSRYEGFGLTVLEAFAHGAPVICSSTSSLPEVAGDAVLYIDPDDAQGLADSITRVVEDPKLQAELARKGAKQLKKFSWAKTARILHNVLTR